jgi:hypothetical protein
VINLDKEGQVKKVLHSLHWIEWINHQRQQTERLYFIALSKGYIELKIGQVWTNHRTCCVHSRTTLRRRFCLSLVASISSSSFSETSVKPIIGIVRNEKEWSCEKPSALDVATSSFSRFLRTGTLRTRSCLLRGPNMVLRSGKPMAR